MIRNSRKTFLLALLFSCVSALPILARGPWIADYSLGFSGNDIVVSYSVKGALDRPDMKEAILSTRPVTLTFYAQVIKHRALWKDKVIAEKVVKHIVRYDTLTKQYKVQTLLDDVLSEERSLASWDEMVGYMVSIADLKVVSVADLEPSENSYTVRVKVHVLSNLVLWIIPWSVETPWVEKKLVTP